MNSKLNINFAILAFLEEEETLKSGSTLEHCCYGEVWVHTRSTAVMVKSGSTLEHCFGCCCIIHILTSPTSCPPKSKALISNSAVGHRQQRAVPSWHWHWGKTQQQLSSLKTASTHRLAKGPLDGPGSQSEVSKQPMRTHWELSDTTFSFTTRCWCHKHFL